MSSLRENFEELKIRLGHGNRFHQNTDDPVYYLVFSPEEILTVHKQLKQWMAKLKIDGWTVHTFSMAQAIHTILKENDLRDIWLMSEKDDPFDFDAINKTLSDAITANDELKNLLQEKLSSLNPDKEDLLFVTDLEALHPFVRVGTIEQKLQGKFNVPTVFLYPGIRTGRSSVRFLGIYPDDGNYRANFIGG